MFCHYIFFDYTATYDVQTAVAKASGNNTIGIDVEFIENTTAKGCFVVLQNLSESHDMFVAVPRSQSSIENIPASMYAVLIYDLEQDGMPNTSPAYEQTNYITVSGIGKKTRYFPFLSMMCISVSIFCCRIRPAINIRISKKYQCTI